MIDAWTASRTGPLGTSAIPDIVFQLLKITQKRTNPGHDRLAELCQHDATPGAIEELRLELALKDGAISVSAHSVALDSKLPNEIKVLQEPPF